MPTGEQQKVVFVTGAGSGIGRAAAEAFVRRGYATVLADVDPEAGVKAEAELSQWGECSFALCDVTDDACVAEAVTLSVATYGRLDAAFNAAGIDGEHGKPTAECTMENWNRVIAVDLTGTFSCMRYEIPAIDRVRRRLDRQLCLGRGIARRTHRAGLHRGQARCGWADKGRRA